ncbi:MAG: 4Fe-4S binding protein [Desulfobacterales bacterium]|nr:4Fe-4S binding protein [Desulfobacterales bacterium]
MPKKKRVPETEPATPDQPPGKARIQKKKFNQTIYLDWCKACGICIAFCPSQVFDADENGRPLVARPDACTGCRFCEQHCPDFAISITEPGAGPEAKER